MRQDKKKERDRYFDITQDKEEGQVYQLVWSELITNI